MVAVEMPQVPDVPPPLPAAPRVGRVWKFWGTTIWGLFLFAGLFLGQLAVVAWLVYRRDGPFSLEAVKEVAGGGTALSLSVIAGLPAVVAIAWLAIHLSRVPFADYLGLRSASWGNILIGVGGLIALVIGWDLVSRLLGKEASPSFMVDVLKSAMADNALWLLVLAFGFAAPIAEEVMVRGFLYRGWSESFLRPLGAVILSSLVWTAMHAQYYDWFLFSEVFSIGLLLGYMRYRSGSTWLTILMHCLNNLAATLQTFWLAG